MDTTQVLWKSARNRQNNCVQLILAFILTILTERSRAAHIPIKEAELRRSCLRHRRFLSVAVFLAGWPRPLLKMKPLSNPRAPGEPILRMLGMSPFSSSLSEQGEISSMNFAQVGRTDDGVITSQFTRKRLFEVTVGRPRPVVA
jgi:hypothetical protein